MAADWHSLANGLHVNPPATNEELSAFGTAVEYPLPEDYVSFLSTYNGAEGFINKAYISIWSIEEALGANDGYCVRRFAPGLFLFASDRGGTGYGFDFRAQVPDVLEVDLMAISFSEATWRAESFTDFMNRLSLQ